MDDDRPWYEGDMTGFDLETTGTDPFTCLPVSYALVHFVGPDVMGDSEGLVDPGIPIPAEASAVHGITDKQVRGKQTVGAAMAYVGGLLAGTSSRGAPIVGMNIAYDLTVVRCCMERTTELTYAFETPAAVIDLMILDKHVDQYRRGKRTLSALCEVYGVELGDQAHNAQADVVASVRCVQELARRHPSIGRMDLQTLHMAQVGWNREQKRGLSKYFVEQGNPPIPDWQMEWPVYPTPEAAA